jgi:prepilin peptidase CpaA
LFPSELNSYPAVGSVVVGTLAAILDLKYRKIPNWLTFPAMLLGILFNLMIKDRAWYFSIFGLLVGLLMFLLPLALGGIGAGDVKLMMALGAFLGMETIFRVGLYGGIAGGILSLAAIIFREGFIEAKRRLVSLVLSIWDKDVRVMLLTPDQTSKSSIPYGLAIYIGLIAGLIWGPFWE